MLTSAFPLQVYIGFLAVVFVAFSVRVCADVRIDRGQIQTFNQVQSPENPVKTTPTIGPSQHGAVSQRAKSR